MTETTEKTSEQLYREWLGHPYWKYRGCAPDPDDPQRMAGDPELHVGAHHAPDAWNPEGQIERREREEKAIEVCLNCPVMVACDLYASSVTLEGKLAQPDGVWGGRRALERHRALIKQRVAATAAPNRSFETVQKRAVLRALAVCWDPFEVAERAEMDVRTANWQRSSLVRLLGLPKDVSRMRALAAARERGLLEGVDLVVDDGSVPAIPPPTKVPDSEKPSPVPMPVYQMPDSPPPVPMPSPEFRARRSRGGRVQVIPGQLSFDDALAPAPVTPLFPSRRMEAAA